VYQIYPRSFADSDGDGVGDLRGVIEHLDHLEALGIDVVWLSPIHRSPQDDNGYDISDYRDVDPLFGSLADLDELIAALHARGMKLLMDLVVNHTSDEHPWFVASRDEPGSERRDRYRWRPPRPGMAAGAPGAEPTNWRSFFSGSAWELDRASGEYYLHLFSRKQPDLNWEQPAVREAVYSMMRWWMDRGVDGFRMDVVNMLSKDPALPDGPVLGGGPYGDGSASYICGPRIHEFVHEMHEAVFAGRGEPALTVGEMPGVTIEDAVLFTDPARRELDMVFQFEHVGVDHAGSKWAPQPLDLRDLKASLGRWQQGLAATGWNSLYWCNHDQPRVVSRWGDDSDEHRVRAATMLATVLHLHRGTPYVYQGEELGMTNVAFASIEEFRDIEAINHYRSAVARGEPPAAVLASMGHHRDNARTPMQWDASRHAGFTTGTPWIAVNPNHTTINAAAARADERSVFHHYRRLIELRHTSPVVVDGAFAMLAPEHPHVYAFTRTLGSETLLVAGNFSGDHQVVDGLDDWDGADVVIANVEHPAPISAGLGPWGAVVLRRVR
jgi:oligo-1,6-glucosidase